MASAVRTVAQVRREFLAAEKRSLAFAESRSKLPPGSSRARVTTANARWSTAAEHRDRLATELAALELLEAWAS